MRKSLALLVLSLAPLLAVPAKATIVVTDYGDAFPPAIPFIGSTYVETFDSSPTSNVPTAGHKADFSDLVATYTSSDAFPRIEHGALSGLFAAPLHDRTNYLSVFGDSRETILLNSNVVGQNFGLFIGSLDAYNRITFFDGTTKIASFSGSDIQKDTKLSGKELHDTGCATCANANGYVTFTGLGPFTKVVLESTLNSFEVDDVTINYSNSISQLPPVPEASTWRSEERRV